MIVFKPERLKRVCAFLKQFDEHEDDAFDHIHRALGCSFKIESRAKCDTTALIGAIGYLLMGEPEEFEDTHPEKAMALAGRLFQDKRPESGVNGATVLFDHAQAVFSVKPKNDDGYINLEKHHLTLIGGRYLFLMAVRALVNPYMDEHTREHPGMLTYVQAVVEDLAYNLRPEVVQATLAEHPRHWGYWGNVTREL